MALLASALCVSVLSWSLPLFSLSLSLNPRVVLQVNENSNGGHMAPPVTTIICILTRKQR